MNSAPADKLDRVVLDGLMRGASETASSDDVAAPFAEGGKARDIVDLCTRLSLPSIFLNRTGQVFHVSDTAAALMQGTLAVEAARLVTATETPDDTLEEAIGIALCAMDSKASRRMLKLRDRQGGVLQLTVLDYPNASPYQLLKVVVVLGRSVRADSVAISQLERQLNAG